MTGVQAQAARLLEGFSKLTFKAARQNGKYLNIGQLEVIMMALEKQVPQEPYAEPVGEAPNGSEIWQDYCPRCNFDFEEYELKYCPNCGQAIDWRKK